MNTRNGSFDTLISGRRFWLSLLASIGLTLGVLALATGSARADYPGHGPDENASEAYGPLQGAHMYSATLNNSGNNPDDQDWYYFYVPAAGDHLHWTVSNTTATTGCQPHGIYYCSVYATLENSDGQQEGGGNSSAGTSGVGPGQTQSIDWTFNAPGKYYIAFIGAGDVLNYQFSVTPASGVSNSPSGGGSQPPSLHLSAQQHRRYVDLSLVVPSAGADLTASLYTGSGSSRRIAGQLRRMTLPKGDFHGAIKLTSHAWSVLKKRHHLTVRLQVFLRPKSGKVVRASKKLILEHP